jgi:hypothetical protein
MQFAMASFQHARTHALTHAHTHARTHGKAMRMRDEHRIIHQLAPPSSSQCASCTRERTLPCQRVSLPHEHFSAHNICGPPRRSCKQHTTLVTTWPAASGAIGGYCCTSHNNSHPIALHKSSLRFTCSTPHTTLLVSTQALRPLLTRAPYARRGRCVLTPNGASTAM